MRRRVGWPTVLVLLAFFVLAGTLVYKSHEDGVRERQRASFDGHAHEEPSHDGPDTYTHHDWSQIPASSGVDLDPIYDPQRRAMNESIRRNDGSIELEFAPVVRQVRVVSYDGPLPIENGATCETRILPVHTSSFNCLVRVRCDGHILYPNPSQTAGFVPCEIENGRVVRAHDGGVTEADGDPRMTFDVATSDVSVSDEGAGVTSFRAELTMRMDS